MAFVFQTHSRGAMIASGLLLGEEALKFKARTGQVLVLALDSPKVAATGKSLAILGAGLVVEPDAYSPFEKNLPPGLLVNTLFEPASLTTEIRPNQRLIFNDVSGFRPSSGENPISWVTQVVNDRRQSYPAAVLIAISNLNPKGDYDFFKLKRGVKSALDASIEVTYVGEAFQRRLSISTNDSALEQGLKNRLMVKLRDLSPKTRSHQSGIAPQ